MPITDFQNSRPGVFTKHRCLSMLALTISIAVLAGCEPPNNEARVNVEYDQLANFYEYRLAPDSSGSTGASDGMFILYRIKSITNTGTSAKTYVFDKHKILAVTSDKTSNEEPSGDAILLQTKLATSLTVQPGEVKTNPGCVIKRVLTSDPKSLFNTSALVDLLHQIDTSQPVSLTRAQSDTSTALVGDALPSTLQGLC